MAAYLIFSFPSALNKRKYDNMTAAIIATAALKPDRHNVPLRSYHGTVN